MENEKRLIDVNTVVSELKRFAIEHPDAYLSISLCVEFLNSFPTVDTVEIEKYNALREDIENLKEEARILSQKRANIFEITSAYERGMVAGIKDFAKKLCEDRIQNDPVVIAVKTELKVRGVDKANDHCNY